MKIPLKYFIPFQRLVFIDQYKNEQSFIALYSENAAASKGETDYHVRGYFWWVLRKMMG